MTTETVTAWTTRRGAFAQAASMTARSLVSIRNQPAQLVEFVMIPLMILLSVTFFMGGQMMGSWQAFLDYAGPSIIAMGLFFAITATGLGLFGDLKSGVFDRLTAMPVSRFALLAGRVAADMVKHAWSLLIVGGVAFAIGYRADGGVAGVAGAAGVMLLFLFACSWTMVLVGLTAKSEEQIQTWMISLLMPLAYTSTIFVQKDTLPEPVQWWATVNPLTSMADSMRVFLDGGTPGGELLALLGWCAALFAVFVPLSLRAYRRKLTS
ncbi:ABC transporter permease [Glycomyces harbinensis]|uniref:Transport permease protein n=1 Tax=Glycomyces harbinensis TaxID=58114 RepID=A0A1G7A4R1_9ACTN|nr:ABC transporter permease [Glycomyces harbinensis]SDE09864.1 ABC-2 type transport system permease protein/oleandomycin transport system permease protein [Glycomyces harbinensis]